MIKTLYTILFQIIILSTFAQGMWNQSNSDSFSGDAQISANNALFYTLDLNQFKNELIGAPVKNSNRQISSVTVELPLPNGISDKFMVFEAPIMEDGLALKFPNLKTYIFQSVSDQSRYGRADVTHKGFHIMMFSSEGTIFIDPFNQASNENYIVYYKKDFYTSKELPVCMSTDETEELGQEIDPAFQFDEGNTLKAIKASNGATLRTYRLAMSATAEYTQFHGGTVADGLAAIVTTVNRINGVYEREFTARLVLVANNDQIVYTNAATDPFNNPNNSGQLLGENQFSVNSTIGTANYDVGHVVGRSGSGLASFGVVCRNQSKASATTGISNPIGDPFDIDYVAHEIGHQFAGSHTYNGSSGSCGGNISTNSAYEPGSGTTVMAYAGICAPQNVQNNSDDYFHTRSFDQVLNYTTQSSGDNCPVKTVTGNSIPQIQIITQSGITIPKSTPFDLEASATDFDGDLLTYCWEQYDLGPSSAPATPSGNAPIFRSFSPTTNPIRTFPQISDIVDNIQTMGEILPSYGRNMNFRITVRDNVPGGGAVNYDNMSVSVSNGAGPFLVTTPNTSITWTAGNTYPITWDVANTSSSPVNCSTVNILLSLDGGYTYNITLASNVPNNGTNAIVAPFAITTEARVRVEAADNIFFDISDQDFEIETDCANVDPSITFPQGLQDATLCENAQGQLSFQVNSPGLTISSYQWFFNGIAISGANTEILTISNVQLTDAGNYFCTVSNGCNTSTTNTATVFVTTNPIIPTITQVGNQLQSSIQTGNQWYYEGSLLPGETDQFIDITQSGTYIVKSIAGSCSQSSASFLATGIKDLNSLTNIQISPNPSAGIFRIKSTDYFEDITVSVQSVLGQEVIQSMSFKQETLIDLSHLSTGIFIATLTSNGYSSSYKLLKQ